MYEELTYQQWCIQQRGILKRLHAGMEISETEI